MDETSPVPVVVEPEQMDGADDGIELDTKADAAEPAMFGEFESTLPEAPVGQDGRDGDDDDDDDDDGFGDFAEATPVQPASPPPVLPPLPEPAPLEQDILTLPEDALGEVVRMAFANAGEDTHLSAPLTAEEAAELRAAAAAVTEPAGTEANVDARWQGSASEQRLLSLLGLTEVAAEAREVAAQEVEEARRRRAERLGLPALKKTAATANGLEEGAGNSGKCGSTIQT